MRSSTLFVHFLTFLFVAHAYIIPVTHTTRSARLTTHPSTPNNATSLMFARDSSSKYVVAHHMVGNTYPYNSQDWADDISLAHASGIDGFALNMGSDAWQPARVSDAYDAALKSGLDFKLFISLDMTSMPCASPNDAEALRNVVTKYISHPHQLQIDSRAVVSSFSGQDCTFGHGNVPDGWRNEVVGHPDLQGKIHFVPSFFIDPATFGSFRGIMDGDFNWNAAWPIQLTTAYVRNLLSSRSADDGEVTSEEPSLLSRAGSPIDVSSARVHNALSQFIGSTAPDTQHLQKLGALSGGLSARTGTSKPTYMAPVSPWFFTHYGADTYNKNFIYLSDQHLYSKRWESLIATRDQVDIVQILTWNDYGESHYIGPIKGAQPNSQAWVDGMDHTGWLELTQYYATAFKTGTLPAVKTDKLFMWSRTHPTHANAPDPIGQPTNFELFEDAVWVVAMATAPSTVVLSTSPTNSKTFQVPAGLTKLSISITAGGNIHGTIARGGKTLVTLNPSKFTFQQNPKIYNFNAFVASS